VTQVFFGVNDQQTAEYVSNRLGDATIIVESGGTGTSVSRSPNPQGGTSCSHSSSTNNNWQQLGRKLLRPEEVTGLNGRAAITFTPGVPPIYTWLVRYYEGGYGQPSGLTPMRMAFDTACFFLPAAFLAVLFTIGLIQHTF
jgi:type IV secretion system protein VirD4